MKMLIKGLGTIASIGAGLLGTKIISAVWKRVTGEQPPAVVNPEIQQRATISKVLTFAIISGSSAAVIQAIVRRWTQKLAEKH